MRQVRISEDVGLAAFAQYEQRVNEQLRSKNEAMMAQQLAAEMESESVDGFDDLGRKGGFFKKLVKFHKKLSPVSLLRGKKRGGGGAAAPEPAEAPTGPPPVLLVDANGYQIPYVPGQPYPPPGASLSPASQQAVASGAYAAYGAPSAYAPAPGMTTPTGGGWASPAPSYGPEPGLPSAGPAPAPYPSGGAPYGAPAPYGPPAEAPLPEPPPEEGGEGGEGEEGGPEGEEGAPPRAATPKPPADNLPAHVPTGTTALVATETPWVKYALIAGGVIAVGAAIYFFVIKKKKPE